MTKKQHRKILRKPKGIEWLHKVTARAAEIQSMGVNQLDAFRQARKEYRKK